MRFQKGNRLSPGRPKGVVSTDRRRFAATMRTILEEHGADTLRSVLRGRNPAAKMRALEFIASYAVGRPVDRVAIGLDADSPEGILLRLAGQTVPGLGDDDPPQETAQGVAGYLEAPEE